ncbi:hypothetical protein HDU92_005070 [Lobulomyces angularis]|nr:hypothetical protein HDU92_005070 [Lobulomyces angularis]
MDPVFALYELADVWLRKALGKSELELLADPSNVEENVVFKQAKPIHYNVYATITISTLAVYFLKYKKKKLSNSEAIAALKKPLLFSSLLGHSVGEYVYLNYLYSNLPNNSKIKLEIAKWHNLDIPTEVNTTSQVNNSIFNELKKEKTNLEEFSPELKVNDKKKSIWDELKSKAIHNAEINSKLNSWEVIRNDNIVNVLEDHVADDDPFPKAREDFEEEKKKKAVLYNSYGDVVEYDDSIN